MKKSVVLIITGLVVSFLVGLLVMYLLLYYSYNNVLLVSNNFLTNQKFVLIRIYPEAKISCQYFWEDKSWHCSGFGFIEEELMEGIDWSQSLGSEQNGVQVLDMLGLNRKVNRVIGRKILKEESGGKK